MPIILFINESFIDLIGSLQLLKHVKKAVAFGLMAYFLLLTTGMFVCIVHCAAEKLIEKVDNNAKINNGDDDDNCKHNDSCDCCKKHDNFVIKENIKPRFEFQLTDVTLPANYLIVPDFNISTTIVRNICWPDCHAPPGRSGKTISIILHSLQI